ncbi:phenylalanine--tRNA ligase beta subunit, cytoplasmic isoform X3 [Populus trichocarpa]|uniref:phenylalanine--tRNA ligase beta subunit, cytoplasmic isoform X3 n=1 Tax=Populus trichocarpa TaxID=3694 RepID=UPI002277EABE|nr:phenylalanine--tRNA ligase beta subunit, cytoplasmic isoform X3 [Populus trichocarpa]
MPTVSVGRDRLFSALGKSYSQEEFEDLCFKFGIELDDVTTEKAIIRKERHLDEEDGGVGDDDGEIIYKIEVPANRYDLLCLEGIAQALRVFNEEQQTPTYTLASIPKDSMLKMHVKPQTSSIRPFVVCAVLRDITFDEASYNSFIDLQDKLHQNICRRRTLVAIGTHDLDTLQGPFTYEALHPKSINFVPLKQEKSFRADELMEFYKSDMKLKKFLQIIENSPVFPVIHDSKRTVLSLPPIINGAHSAITLKTKNVFIECTATDLTKANIVLNTMVTIFSAYCQRKFEVEPVEVIYSDGRSFIYPDLSVYNMEVPLSYITGSIGVSLEAEKVTSLLNRMQLRSEHSVLDDNKCNINVSVPPTRSDILHPCDVMEDVAIAYGYNDIPKRRLPSMKPLPLNQLEDLIRAEIAMNGFTEVLTWILCSNRENFALLNREDDQSSAVIIGNPRSSDFEAVRTSLMPGALKIIGHNKDHPKPIKDICIYMCVWITSHV